MSTVSVKLKLIKDGSEYKSNIADSYTFRNASIVIAVLADTDKLINTVKNVKYCKSDSFISFDAMEASNEILNKGMNDVYTEMKDSKISANDWQAVGRMLIITIDYDKQIYTDSEETYTFDYIRRYILEGIFNE